MSKGKQARKPNGGGGKMPPAEIHITYVPGGPFQVKGPAENPILFLGMLDMARTRYLIEQAKSEIKDERAQRKIVSPHGGHVPPHRT